MPGRILIIDSDWSSVRALERDLVARGFQVLTAPDGMIGVQRALRERPDLIVLEVQFPAGGVSAVFQRLKMSLITRDIPVIIFSSVPNAQEKRRLLDLGLLTYIQKPGVDQLVGEIHKRLDRVVSSGDYQPPAPSSPPVKPIRTE